MSMSDAEIQFVADEMEQVRLIGIDNAVNQAGYTISVLFARMAILKSPEYAASIAQQFANKIPDHKEWYAKLHDFVDMTMSVENDLRELDNGI